MICIINESQYIYSQWDKHSSYFKPQQIERIWQMTQKNILPDSAQKQLSEHGISLLLSLLCIRDYPICNFPSLVSS